MTPPPPAAPSLLLKRVLASLTGREKASVPQGHSPRRAEPTDQHEWESGHFCPPFLCVDVFIPRVLAETVTLLGLPG